MKRILLYLLLSASVVSAQVAGRLGIGIPLEVNLGANVTNATPHNHPASPLFFETFEGTGYSTAGWGSFTDQTGTVDPDFTGVVLDGSQSLKIVGSTAGSSYITNSFSAQSVVYTYFQFRLTETLPAPNIWLSVFRLRDVDGATVFKLQLSDENFLRFVTGGVENVVPTPITTNVTYHCWMSWSKNTGSNSEATLALSTTKVQPTSGDLYRTIPNGATVANDASQVFLGYANDLVDDAGSEMTVLYDYVLIDDVAVPDYP